MTLQGLSPQMRPSHTETLLKLGLIALAEEDRE
jgi:hypothetical protein